MLKSLRLRYFQGHKDSYLTFSPGINVISGSTEAGKSSLIRAIRWEAENRPSGEGFISHFSPDDSTLVEIETDTDVIGRERGKGINSYWLNGMQFSAMGHEVPKEISEKLNLREINIQYQMDSPYLLSKSSGEVAKTLNKLIGLDKIDSSLQNIASKKRQNEQDIRYLQGRVEEQERTINEFPDLENIEYEIKFLESLRLDLNTFLTSQEVLSQNITDLKQTEEKLSEIKKITVCLPIWEQLEIDYKDYNELLSRNKELNKILNEIKECKEKKETHKKSLSFILTIKRLEVLLNEIKKLNVNKGSLTKTIYNTKKTIQSLNTLRADMEDNLKLFQENLTDYCNLYDTTCPLYK